MYFYTKLITIFNNNSFFYKHYTSIPRDPKKRRKRFSNQKLNRNDCTVPLKPLLKIREKQLSSFDRKV